MVQRGPALGAPAADAQPAPLSEKAQAPAPASIAVLELKSREALKRIDRRYLSDLIRQQVKRELPKLTLMSRENITLLLSGRRLETDLVRVIGQISSTTSKHCSDDSPEGAIGEQPAGGAGLQRGPRDGAKGCADAKPQRTEGKSHLDASRRRARARPLKAFDAP
jgi:hypothetical protein